MSALRPGSTPPPTDLSGIDPTTRAAVLVEALPYIRAFADSTVVIKLGGSTMVDETLADSFAADVVLLRAVGIRCVVVHGGGPQIGRLMARLGKEPEFRNGLRVTDEETLAIARMVLGGQVSRDIVAAINRHDPRAVALSGEDAGLIAARRGDPDLGLVGEVTGVHRSVLDTLADQGFIPVISTIGTDESGQALNINADAVAVAVAESLTAEKLIHLTDVAGVCTHPDDPATLLSDLTATRTRLLIDEGVISGGMIPKVEACVAAIEAGVGSAHVLDGRVRHAVLLELLTDGGVGTMLTRSGGSS